MSRCPRQIRRRVSGRRQNKSDEYARKISEPPETIDALVPEGTSAGEDGVAEAARSRLLSDVV